MFSSQGNNNNELQSSENCLTINGNNGETPISIAYDIAEIVTSY